MSKKNTDLDISAINVNGNSVNKPEEISDIFCNYFNNIGAKITEQILPTEKSYKEFMPSSRLSSFWFNPISTVELANLIEQLKCKYSTDSNGLSNVMMKNIAIEIAIPLTIIVNKSVLLGVFPEKWKSIKILPIYKKKGDRLEVENYRAIVIVNLFAKIMEMAIQSRVIPYF